jgi:hypothetical protein
MNLVGREQGLSDQELFQALFVSRLKIVAKSFYDDNHQPYTLSLPGKGFQPVADGMPFVRVKVQSNVVDWLLSKGITEVSAYKQGGTADILAARTQGGKVCAIRIPIKAGYEINAHHRINDPAFGQPFPDCILSYRKGQNIEILPIVSTIKMWGGLTPDETIFNLLSGRENMEMVHGVLRVMHGMLGVANVTYKQNDCAVFPGGVFILTDPDQAERAGEELSTEQRAFAYKMIVQMYPYMESVLWINADGTPKQDKFFGDDYLSTPLPPTQRTKITIAAPAPR